LSKAGIKMEQEA